MCASSVRACIVHKQIRRQFWSVLKSLNLFGGFLFLMKEILTDDYHQIHSVTNFKKVGIRKILIQK